MIYDSSYKQIATIRGGNGYQADLHEMRLTLRADRLDRRVRPDPHGTSAEHGARNGILTDAVVQEIDVKTGLVMWEWHALGHVPLTDSTLNRPTHVPVGLLHVNSIDPGSSKTTALLAQHLRALRRRLKTGAFNWQLGGQALDLQARPRREHLLPTRR